MTLETRCCSMLFDARQQASYLNRMMAGVAVSWSMGLAMKRQECSPTKTAKPYGSSKTKTTQSLTITQYESYIQYIRIYLSI